MRISRRRSPSTKRSRPAAAIRILSVPAGAVALAGLLMLVYVGWFVLGGNLPDLEEIESQNFELTLATVAYTYDGVELGRFGYRNRTWVPYDSLPTHVVGALVATEDRRFRSHWGIDVWRTFSAVTQTLLGRLGLPFAQQGGSTITQQLARNLYNSQIGFEVSVERKLKEMAAAVQLERRYAKDEIIEMYLNTVPFRHNAFGIEGAARTYFGTSSTALDTLEAAALVGMLKATTRYDPERNPENSRQRRNVVLRLMVNQGLLDREFYEAHASEPTPTTLRTADVTDSFAPYVAEHVRQFVQTWGREHDVDVYAAGLKVYTTIDSRLQAYAQEAVTTTADQLQAVADCEWSAPANPRHQLGEDLDRYLRADCHQHSDKRFAYFWNARPDAVDAFIRDTPAYRQRRDSGQRADAALASLRSSGPFMDSLRTARTRLEAGFVAMDPRSGHIRAWVGGRGLESEWYDHVTLARRQPGSAFKPILYAAAIQNGWTPEAVYTDSLITYRPRGGGTWTPGNFGDALSHERLTLRQALEGSVNTVAAQLIYELGPAQVVQVARGMGIDSRLESVLSLALGTSEVTLLELTTAYGTLANYGVRSAPVVVLRIEDQHGVPLYTAPADSEVGLSEATAITVVDMMRGVIHRGTGGRIRTQFGQCDYDFAGKTGTTQDGADGWFMLMHPDLVMGAWVGFNDRRVTFRSSWWGQGAHNALFVVGDFLRRSSALDAGARFAEPRPGIWDLRCS